MKRPTNWLTVATGLSLLLVMLKPAPLAAAQQISSGNNSLDQFQVFTLVGGVTVAGVGLRGVYCLKVWLVEVVEPLRL